MTGFSKIGAAGSIEPPRRAAQAKRINKGGR